METPSIGVALRVALSMAAPPAGAAGPASPTWTLTGASGTLPATGASSNGRLLLLALVLAATGAFLLVVRLRFRPSSGRALRE